MPTRWEGQGLPGLGFSARDGANALDLLGLQGSRLSGPQALNGDPALRRPIQAHHRVPHCRAQTLDQVRPTFGHDDANPGVLLRSLEHIGLGGPGHAVLEPDTFDHPLQGLRRRRPLHLREVRPANLELRMGERMRQFAIVGHDQRAFGVEVESPDREHTNAHVADVVGHSGAALRVLHGGDHADRLVQQQVRLLLGHFDEGSIHSDQVSARLHLRAELPHGDVVHGHAALGDELFCVTARGNPCARKEFLKAFRHARPFSRGDRARTGLCVHALPFR